MKKKLISLLLSAAVIASMCIVLAGCGDKNADYPVTVANITIDEEPENIVVLSPETADIISYTGYDVKMAGRSDEVNQEFLSIVPSVGTCATPDVAEIKESGATIVFADGTLDDAVKQELENDNITVITLAIPNTPQELETAYVTAGTILGGAVTGSNKGGEAYQDLVSSMETVKSSVNSGDILKTVCYLYLDNGVLNMCTSGTYGDMLLGYTGAVNAAVQIEDSEVDAQVLKIANPNYIFYADEETLEYIKNDSTLSGLSAIKNKNAMMVTEDEINRMGRTALETLQKMVFFMYPELDSSNEDTKPEDVKAESVADDYDIDLDGLSLEIEDENDDVKAMQQRLYDLGYVDDKDNITGYYGEVTKAAVKAFQKASGIKETGKADNATLTALFESTAEKAD